MSDHLLVEHRGGVAVVVLNKIDSHNAISIDMYKDLPGIMADLDADRSVKVIVLRGAGQKSFASGADISEFERERGNAEAARNYNEHVAAAERAIEQPIAPTVPASARARVTPGVSSLGLTPPARDAQDEPC